MQPKRSENDCGNSREMTENSREMTRNGREPTGNGRKWSENDRKWSGSARSKSLFFGCIYFFAFTIFDTKTIQTHWTTQVLDWIYYSCT